MNTHDPHFHPVVEMVRDTSIVLADGIPDHLKVCKKERDMERAYVCRNGVVDGDADL